MTPQQREVHLLTISQNNVEDQHKGDVGKKPVILMSARVHPGEVSSSYCIQGVIYFLTDYFNLQAYLLRRLFIFKIIPMVNPDGVVCGNYRMDPQGFNLNRLYRQPSKQHHSSIFHISQMMKNLSKDARIQFYFDFHSHSSIKPAFIYGNAFEDIVKQTYSELFCRLLQENCPSFRYGLSNFEEKHMKYKDKGESLSKQGCGRVVIKNYGTVRSYTVQSSIFPSSYEHQQPKKQPTNKSFVYKNKQNVVYKFHEKGLAQKESENILVSQNKVLGKSILVSILDMIKKNPFTRVSQDIQDAFCRGMAQKILQNEQRFKLLDQRAYQKAKNINNLIRFQLQDKLDRLWNNCGVFHWINSINLSLQVKRIAIFKDKQKKDHSSQKESWRLKTQGNKIQTASHHQIKQSLNLVIEKLEGEYQQKKYSSKSLQKKVLLPQIKYSAQIQQNKPKMTIVSQQRQTQNSKRPPHEKLSSRQIQLSINNLIQHQRTSKKINAESIHQSISQVQQKIVNRHHTSLNRIINSKLLSHQIHQSQQKGKLSSTKDKQQQNDKYNQALDHNRKRIMTEGRQQKDLQLFINSYSCSKQINERANDNEASKIKTLRYDAIQKKLLPNKVIQLKKNSRLKLPEVNYLNFVVMSKKLKSSASKQEQKHDEESNI